MTFGFGNKRKQSKEQAEELVRRYYDEIYVFAYRQTFNKDTAMDLTQEILISVLRSYDTYDPKKASLRTWIYRIATNRIIDYRRSRTARDHEYLPLDEVEDAVSDSFVQETENRELLEQIEAYVSAFPAATQQVFRFRLYADLSFAEIADLLSMSDSSVKTVYYRLIKQIRKEFSDEY